MAFDVSSPAVNALPRCGSAPVSLPPMPRNQTQALESVPSFDEMSDAIIVRLIAGWPTD
ncbi:hypothetical protein [Paracoccus benzoatiresistens]|uniref:Uncharacterized protein n=1 Tax=Paracoccus benzoatiresistens TaxID=2997341 RepID=A0ABT4JBR4_9RHOB|nr:hypothetical protein [Paracoccus sp. EF6]MCZ0964344.1 hypothetical protein [Paracoccus sp. EF6]